ncbi:MAG: HlyD family efflux transporter periplasmic adaptor subunit [Candidatus Fermentibacteraceae bacterium]|nr:HlyD family efflux transporter periplasmic adaptor subunit [Candidatus Fermentibacteraceae bacterium]
MNKTMLILPILLALACGGGGDNLFSGTIEIVDVRISARVGGAVLQRAVEQGDRIQQGQLLVKIDETEYSIALAQKDAALAISEAKLQTLVSGTRQQQIIAASSDVEAARAARNQTAEDLARARELFSAGAISDQMLQAAETAAVQAQTRLTGAGQVYSLAVEGARSSEIEAAEAAVDLAEAARQLAQQRLEWTTIVSPLTGTVTGTNIEEGENTSPGMTIVTVAAMDTVKAVFYISEPYLTTVETGSIVTVTADSAGDTQNTVTGKVTHIADQAEFTPSQVETREGRTSLVYRVEASIPNPGSVFKAGMPVDVEISL